MTIDQAIEILEKAQEATEFVGEHPLRSAQKLGIEALEYIQTCQTNPNCFDISLLPSQTKDANHDTKFA